MKSFKGLFIFVLFVLASGITKAQDTLQLVKNSQIIIVKVIEIGLDEIKYQPMSLENSPVVVVDKKDIKKIVLSNGTVMNFYPDQMSTAPSEAVLNKTSAIKFQFFSPLYNNIGFGYETALKKGLNLEFKIALIGIGLSKNLPNSSGFYFKAGPKFWPGKDYYTRGEKRSHPLRGAYIKPEISYSHFWQDEEFMYGTQRVTYDNFAVNIVFGKQYILADAVTLDWYFGMGYGGQSSNFKEDPSITGNYYSDTDLGFEPYAYSHVFSGKDFPLTWTGGLTLGVLIK